jgi:uncharacterized protein
MSVELLLQNLLNPPVLFFFLGLLAVAIRSDLDIPQPISKFLSLYLLFAIGLKGGAELGHSGAGNQLWYSLIIAIGMALLVPAYTFFILKQKYSIHDAGAVAATYGSVSAVTFITATNYASELGIHFDGYMIAMLALMESPAIIIGVLLIGLHLKDKTGSQSMRTIWHEALSNGSVILILGSLIIGILSPDKGIEGLKPFTEDIFKGFLAFFLLDMGLIAGKRLSTLGKRGWFPVLFGIFIPLINAFIAAMAAGMLDIGDGNAFLLCVLSASASYIAVPAAMRMSVPEANPGLYVPMALAITFPFNILIGLPLYFQFVQWF